MSLMEERARAVAETIEQTRRILAEGKLTRSTLARLGEVLVGLARRTELFPQDQFTVPPGCTAWLYRLAEDPDPGLTLYASAAAVGRSTPPHNHTTWAVIAGVYGDERNLMFERIDDRSQPGRGRLRPSGELVVRGGDAVAYMPDDFHLVEFIGDQPALHLHLYGRSLEHLPERIGFESREGGTYKVFPPNPNIGAVRVNASTVKRMIGDGEELALLDVREEGQFATGHLLWAASLPLSRLELRAAALIPRRSARVIVIDQDGGQVAQLAARRLFDFGWKNLAVLEGGIEGWRRAGYEIFSGINVPSKAFGELVEHQRDTPRIKPAELKRRLDQGEDIIILDSRPQEEFQVMSIPGALDCPGAELVYRAFDLPRSAATTVVVNCAGRTRSIIGAQSLINAGMENPVFALENGTMGWRLAGLELAHGRDEVAPPPSASGLRRAQAAATGLAQRLGVREIGWSELAALQAQGRERTLYCLDVRTPREYQAGHPAGWRCAPGGQLVQATDQYVGTLKSRLVLGDSEGVRARMTASWLIQMGWSEVFVLRESLAAGAQESGPERPEVLPPPTEVASLDAGELREMLARGAATVIDFATSLEYRAGHIEGAWWAIRARLEQALPRLPRTGALVATSPDGVLARFAAADLAKLTARPVFALRAGTAGWRAAGFSLISQPEQLADEPVDVWYRPYQNRQGTEDAMRAYLAWELGLLEQIARDGDARFRVA